MKLFQLKNLKQLRRRKMVEEGKIDKDENVVCYITGNGLKATEAIVDVLPKLNAVKPDVQLVSAMIR